MIDGKRYKYDRHAHCKLRFHKKAPKPYKCHGCKMPGFGPCLKCTDEKCHFYLHQVCYKLQHLPDHQHPFFRHCLFKHNLCSPKASDHRDDVPYCDACGLDILGYRYHCSPDMSHCHDNHDLHPTCAHLNLNKKITMNGVELELRDKVKSKCLHCGKRCPVEECAEFTGWKWVPKRSAWDFLYCFSGNKICYHLKCMNKIIKGSR